MPSPSDHDGTPNRRRRSDGSRGRAKVSVTTTTNNSHSHGRGHSEAAAAAAVLTPASAASSSAASDLRRVRTVRTGDTTVPTGSRSRRGGAGTGDKGINGDDNAGSSGLGSPRSAASAGGPPSPSYQSMGAGTQATATAGGLLYSALGTLQEWTNDLANDLMVAAVESNNHSSNSGNDANANGSSSSSSGGRNAEQVGGTDGGSDRNNDNNDKKKKTSSSPSRKLRAAVVRSLSPSSRRGHAKHAQHHQPPQPQPIPVGGTNPCGPALRQVMDEFVAQATARESDANANNHHHNKPMSKMRQKLAKSTTAATAKSGGTTNNKSHSRAVSVGGGDSTVVARTHNPRKDNANKQEQTKKANATTNSNGTGTGTGTGRETAANKPHIIGPVQFLQHMMATNCMMAGADHLAELGFGGGGGASDDDDDDDDGSSYDDSSFEEDGSDGSDSTGHSSGRNHRRRQQQQSRGGSSGSSRRRAQQQRRSGSGNRRSSGGSRGKGRGRGRRGNSTLSGRPEDIPEGDEDEDSSTVTGAEEEEEEEDLDVIGRRPGAGVVRDKGGGTPRQHNRKSVTLATAGTTRSGDGSSDLRRFATQLIDHGFPLIWHRVHDSKLQMEPTDVATFLVLDEESRDPCLTWDIYDAANGRSRKVVARGSIPLFEIASIEKAEAKQLQAYPFAMPSHSFFVALSNGGVILFEAKDKAQREVFVRGLRWVVARLSFNLIVGNGSICTELGLVGGDALDDEDVDSTMDDVTNRLVDVSVQAVRANSMMKA